MPASIKLQQVLEAHKKIDHQPKEQAAPTIGNLTEHVKQLENALSAWANKFENESPKLHNEIIQNSRKEIDKQIREHNQLKTEELSNLKQTLSTENVPGDGFPNSLCMYNIGIKSHKI